MQVERAVILAAGLGTRLKWMTRHKPKALMNIQGEAAIVHVIRQLAKQGIHQIVINTHHHAEILQTFLGNGERWGVNLWFSHEEILLDSGGGVRTALQYLPGEGGFLVHNADVIADVDVHTLADLCPYQGCALALVDNPRHHPQGDFAIEHGLIRLQGEPMYTFAGVSVWDEAVFQSYACGTPFSLLQVMHTLIKKDKCKAWRHRGQWFDIGRPKDVIRANRDWVSS